MYYIILYMKDYKVYSNTCILAPATIWNQLGLASKMMEQILETVGCEDWRFSYAGIVSSLYILLLNRKR
jgi:hypothetical protein